jgi:hypothetical protein
VNTIGIYGAYPGKHASTKTSGVFAVFPDEDTGWEAIRHTRHSYGQVDLLAAMNRYAPKGHGPNDPDKYASDVAARLGVPVSIYLDELDETQTETLVAAIKEHEGWIEGTSWALDDSRLPLPVQQAIRGY